jgi:hypothetical protein
MVDDVLAEALADAQSVEVSEDKIAVVGKLVQKQLALENKRTSLENALAACIRELEEVQDKQLPDAMMEAGCSRFDTDDGYIVKITHMYLPSILKADEAAVYEELSEAGHSGIIATNVIIPLGKGGHEEAKTIIEQIAEAGLNREAVLDETIHWSTFRAFAKEILEGGDEELPAKIKVHQIMRANIKRPKFAKGD